MEAKKNYDEVMQNIIADFDEKPELFLHSCCGPCSTSVIERLMNDFEVTIFFYNPNIDDRDEYEKRKENQIKFISERYPDGSVKFLEGKYDVKNFCKFAAQMGDLKEGGERCKLCYKFRLDETARLASEMSYDYFTTTLTVSPMKNAQYINVIGEEVGVKYGISFLNSDFKKRGGYQRSIELSKKFNLYRQNFCGCSFSKRDSLLR